MRRTEIKQPYTQSWNLSIQRPIGRNNAIEIRYIGSRSVHQWLNCLPMRSTSLLQTAMSPASSHSSSRPRRTSRSTLRTVSQESRVPLMHERSRTLAPPVRQLHPYLTQRSQGHSPDQPIPAVMGVASSLTPSLAGCPTDQRELRPQPWLAARRQPVVLLQYG